MKKTIYTANWHRVACGACLTSLLLTACAAGLVAAELEPPAPDVTQPPLSDISGQPASDIGGPTLTFPTPTAYPTDERISIGRSVEERELAVWQYGQGPVTLALVGGIHGGYEFNTVVLVEQLAEYVRKDPASILPGIRLVMVPSVNPDGVARGREFDARFNANGVDLNRNWGCGWEPTSYWGDREISPGPRPFSEPETVALRTYLLAMEPAAVVFYHSAADAIFVGGCGESSPASTQLGNLLSEATGYPNEVEFEYYGVSGTADDWLDERGIPAVTVELADRYDPEFARNLAGMMALQCHFALHGDTGLEPAVVAQVGQWCAQLEPYSPDD